MTRPGVGKRTHQRVIETCCWRRGGGRERGMRKENGGNVEEVRKRNSVWEDGGRKRAGELDEAGTGMEREREGRESRVCLGDGEREERERAGCV